MSIVRIAPSKMLPSENRRAICDVTFRGVYRGPEESDIVTAHAKWEYLKAIHVRSRQATRPEKHQILDECCRVTGYHRKHAVRLLNGPAPSGDHPAPGVGAPHVQARRHRGAPDDLGGGRLSVVRPPQGVAPALAAPGPAPPAPLSRAVERQLLAISSRQIDRRLIASCGWTRSRPRAPGSYCNGSSATIPGCYRSSSSSSSAGTRSSWRRPSGRWWRRRPLWASEASIG